MNDPQRRASYITIAVSFLLVTGLGGATFFLYQHLQTVKTEIQSIQERIAILETEKSAIRDFQIIQMERKTDIDHIKAFFIEKDRPLLFIETVEMLGRKTNTKLSLDAEVPKQNEPHFTFRVTAEGTYRDVVRLLTLIERLPYEVAIRSYGITVLTADREKARLTIALQVKTQ